MEALEIYNEVKKKYNLNEIAQKLHLHAGTLKRWEVSQKIPNDYLWDLNALLANKYKIPKDNFRSHSEFFTKKSVAKYCMDSFLNFLKIHKLDSKKYHFIEPSCGDCSFYDLMPQDSRVGIDLEYKNDEILHQNFLDFAPLDSHKKYIVLGNPPFGLRGNLALRFINHASSFADFVAFILPPLFDSDGKGSPKKRVENFVLIHSEKLPLDSFVYPNGKSVEVATLFQIWVHRRLVESKQIKIDSPAVKTCKDYIKVYSLSDGGTPSSTRNKAMLNVCDLYLPSTCFHSKNNPQMKIYYDFESLPNRRGYGIVILKDKKRVKEILEKIDWANIGFLGTNSSLNLRTSLIENALIECGIYDRGLF